MEIRYSIIIPTYNRKEILKEVLQNIFNLPYKQYEIIVVVDGSTDGTEVMLSGFPCRIVTHKESKQVCISRNDGAKIAKGEILLFIDDDMLVPQNMFEIMDHVFFENKEYDALFGPFAAQQRYHNFASEYKNLYMHYAFYMLPERVYLLIGGSTAIRKKVFDTYGGFDEKYIYPYGEDHDLGARIGIEHKIYRCREYLPEHIKHYNWKQVLKCDFDRSVALIRLILRKIFITKETLYLSKTTPKGYSSTSLIVTGCIYLSGIAGIFQPILTTVSGILYLLLLAINFRFLYFLLKQKGIIYFIKSCLFIFLDLSAIGFGSLFALISFLLGNRKY